MPVWGRDGPTVKCGLSLFKWGPVSYGAPFPGGRRRTSPGSGECPSPQVRGLCGTTAVWCPRQFAPRLASPSPRVSLDRCSSSWSSSPSPGVPSVRAHPGSAHALPSVCLCLCSEAAPPPGQSNAPSFSWWTGPQLCCSSWSYRFLPHCRLPWPRDQVLRATGGVFAVSLSLSGTQSPAEE